MEKLKRLWFKFLNHQATPVHATHPKSGKERGGDHNAKTEATHMSRSHTWKSHGGFRH